MVRLAPDCLPNGEIGSGMVRPGSLMVRPAPDWLPSGEIGSLMVRSNIPNGEIG